MERPDAGHTPNLGNGGEGLGRSEMEDYAAGIATSHDTAEAIERIEDFKTGQLDILVTIAMAYEGLDVPEVSHIACLTHIRREYPLGRPVRGTGIPRVPTEPQFMDGSEFDDSFLNVFSKFG